MLTLFLVVAMFDEFPVLEVGPVAIAGTATMMVLTGWLVPRWVLKQRELFIERLETRLTVRDEQVTELIAQLRVVSEVGETVNAVMRAVQRGPTTHSDEGP